MSKTNVVDFIRAPEPPKPCGCTQEVMIKSSKNHVQLLDMAIAVYPNGKERPGIRSIKLDAKRTNPSNPGMIPFKFCPWCGVKLFDEVNHDVAKIDH